MITTPPGISVLILAEDDFFLHSDAAIPGNAHILSTRAFLETLYELGKIPSANAIWEAIQHGRPDVNRDRVDRQAGKINTNWQSAIDSEKAKSVSKKNNKQRLVSESACHPESTKYFVFFTPHS